jgi:alkylated DNA repair protein (DNA oxidative demethylase)
MKPMPPRRERWKIRGAGRGAQSHEGHIYEREFLAPGVRAELLQYLLSLHPIWEDRFSPNHPPPPGQKQRRLLRPVYWLGNWQFACLDYYRPPHGIRDRCVRAEPFPKVLAELVAQIEMLARSELRAADIPPGWHLDTCLVNFYGDRREGDKLIDVARVGEHKDFEPGPVASISLGERALLQFVRSQKPGERDEVVLQQWLEDGSLQLFGGPRFKEHLFHRVQRVERKGNHRFPLAGLDDFETRRINLTLRYVPDKHVIPYAQLARENAEDVRGYMETLSQHAPFFARELKSRGAK